MLRALGNANREFTNAILKPTIEEGQNVKDRLEPSH